VTNKEPAGAGIARQASESQTPANIAAKVDYEPIATLTLYVGNCEVKVVCEANARRAREIGNPEDARSWLNDPVSRTARLDYGRALGCPFAKRYFDFEFSLRFALTVGHGEPVCRVDAERRHVGGQKLDAINR
jgi:hypothetical protein